MAASSQMMLLRNLHFMLNNLVYLESYWASSKQSKLGLEGSLTFSRKHQPAPPDWSPLHPSPGSDLFDLEVLLHLHLLESAARIHLSMILLDSSKLSRNL